VAAISFLRRREARKLSHRVKLAAVSGGVNAAREWRLAGIAEMIFVTPIFGKVCLRVEPTNRDAGNRRELRPALLIQVDAGRRADGFFGSLFERGKQRLLGPLLFGVGRMASLAQVSDGTLGDRGVFLLSHG